MTSNDSKSIWSDQTGSGTRTTDHDNDDAVDETGDADGAFTLLQQDLNQRRRAARDCTHSRVQTVFPFPFSPNIRPLSPSDLDSVVALEDAAFSNPEHRATPDKLRYRLTTCPELSLGLFCTVVPGQAKGWEIETLATAKPVETDRADGAVSVLMAHIVSAKCCGETITDKDMDYPKNWQSLGGKSVDVGHQEAGRTVGLHSLAVAPKLQGCGIGKMIVKAYLQQMNNSGLADRVSLLCQDYLVSYYERFGFQNKGESRAEFGGGGWYNMIFRLSGPPKTAF